MTDTPTDDRSSEPSCANDWCSRPRHMRDFCEPCDRRGKKYGDPDRATTVYRAWDVSRMEVDEDAVERLCAGDAPMKTTLGEREAAVRRLHASGLNDQQIANRMGKTVLFVFRVRMRLGLPKNSAKPTR